MALEVKILTLPNIDNDNERIPEKPKFKKLSLGQVDFTYQYIVPNLLFDMSMVYAIAKSRGVSLTKGDFDGIHSYPAAVSFTKKAYSDRLI